MPPGNFPEVRARTLPMMATSRVLPFARSDRSALILKDPPRGAIPPGEESPARAATDPDRSESQEGTSRMARGRGAHGVRWVEYGVAAAMLVLALLFPIALMIFDPTLMFL